MRSWLAIALALLCQFGATAGETPVELDQQAITTQAAALLAIPERAPGRPGSALAAALIEQRLG